MRRIAPRRSRDARQRSGAFALPRLAAKLLVGRAPGAMPARLLEAMTMVDGEVIAPLKLSDGEIQFYREQGYLLLPGLMSEPHARELHDEVMELMSQIGGYEGSKLKQSAEYLQGSAIQRLVESEALRELAGQLMGGSCSLFLPFTAVKGVGGGTVHFHHDNNYTRFDDGMAGINLWL